MQHSRLALVVISGFDFQVHTVCGHRGSNKLSTQNMFRKKQVQLRGTVQGKSRCGSCGQSPPGRRTPTVSRAVAVGPHPMVSPKAKPPPKQHDDGIETTRLRNRNGPPAPMCSCCPLWLPCFLSSGERSRFCFCCFWKRFCWSVLFLFLVSLSYFGWSSWNGF